MLPSTCSSCSPIVNGRASSARMRPATLAASAASGDVREADDELVAAQARDGVLFAQARL